MHQHSAATPYTPKMRKMERAAFLPFTMGCICEPSIAAATNHHQLRRSTTTPKGDCKREVGDTTAKPWKNPSSIMVVRRLQKLLVKSITNVSHLLVYREEESEEEGCSMDIGYPTDVKHVTHIGLEVAADSVIFSECVGVDPPPFWTNATD